jgi:Fe-S-cluster containining protein
MATFISPEQLRDELREINHSQSSMASRGLKANRNKAYSISVMKTVHEKTDALAEQVRKKPAGQFHCKPGCAYCCHHRIEALPAEIFLIAREVKKLPAAQLAEMTARLREHAALAHGLRAEQHRLTCPLLENSMCTVYENRPFACRRFHSLDVEQCKDPEGTPPANEELNLKSAAVMIGMVESYAKRRLPNRPHELGAAVLAALEQPDAEERWFRGEDVFEPLPDIEEIVGAQIPILVTGAQ